MIKAEVAVALQTEREIRRGVSLRVVEEEGKMARTRLHRTLNSSQGLLYLPLQEGEQEEQEAQEVQLEVPLLLLMAVKPLCHQQPYHQQQQHHHHRYLIQEHQHQRQCQEGLQHHHHQDRRYLITHDVFGLDSIMDLDALYESEAIGQVYGTGRTITLLSDLVNPQSRAHTREVYERYTPVMVKEKFDARNHGAIAGPLMASPRTIGGKSVKTTQPTMAGALVAKPYPHPSWVQSQQHM